MARQNFLVIVRSTPYGNHQARAAIDLALTAAAFEQAVDFVFIDNGVLQLTNAQDTTVGSIKNIPDMLAAMPLYDVENLFAHTASVEKYLATDNPLPKGVQTIDDDRIKGLISKADHVMVF